MAARALSLISTSNLERPPSSTIRLQIIGLPISGDSFVVDAKLRRDRAVGMLFAIEPENLVHHNSVKH